MRLLFFLYNHFWIACCALTLLLETRLLVGLPLEMQWLDGVVFGAAVFGYRFFHKIGTSRPVVLGAGIFAAICFFQEIADSRTPVTLLLLCAIPGAFWVSYYRMGKRGLRSHIVAKPILIALTWAWVTVVLPIENQRLIVITLLFVARAAFVFALALAYDLVDSAYDRNRGLKTLVNQIGAMATNSLISNSLIASGAATLVVFFLGKITFLALLSVLLSLAISGVWIKYLPMKKGWQPQHKGLIDALMVIQAFLVLLSQLEFPERLFLNGF